MSIVMEPAELSLLIEICIFKMGLQLLEIFRVTTAPHLVSQIDGILDAADDC
jgi:hypothetical protein